MNNLPDNAVLLPIDMQQAFDEPQWPKRWNGQIDRNGLRVLEAWRSSGRSVIHVCHDSVTPGSRLRPEAPGNALRPGFEPQEGEAVIRKSVNAAFIGTDLDLRLRRMKCDTVVIFGISTDMCVSTSVRVGSNLGYRVILVEDACDCFDMQDGQGERIPAEEVHRIHVATLRHEFANVLRTDELVQALGTTT
ncbi:cysteine hydrolase family protein [Neorhizobium sp. NPDC001467]|uniref:cysteine hydrolase family protein n=1 Tax=Neorhizobium sp. NPDC001467 TaxID=3390595 RepID=UPI003D0360FC